MATNLVHASTLTWIDQRVREMWQAVEKGPHDLIGWDGFLYPWTFSVHDFEPITGDTFYPLKLSKFAKKLDDGKYAYSWYESAEDGAAGEEAAVDGDASGAGLTSHF